MRRLFTIAVTALGLLPAAAAAQDRQQATTLKVEVGGETVSLPAPFGYCDLESGHRRDRVLIEGLDRLPQQDRVLRRLSPCDELQSWRADKVQEPPEIVQMLWPSRLGAVGDDRRAFLRRAVPGELMGQARVLDLARQGFPSGAEETTFANIGLIERSERMALLAQAVVARIGGSNYKLVAVSATTAVGPTPLITQVLSPHVDGTELDWMVHNAREHVDRLLSANGEASQRFGDRRAPRPDEVPPGDVRTRKVRVPRERTTGFFDIYGGEIALGLLIGGAALIAVGLLLARRLRPSP